MCTNAHTYVGNLIAYVRNVVNKTPSLQCINMSKYNFSSCDIASYKAISTTVVYVQP